MPTLEEIEIKVNEARQRFEANRDDHEAWTTYSGWYSRVQGRRYRVAKLVGRASRQIPGQETSLRDPRPPKPGLAPSTILAQATLEHFWPDGSCAVSVYHKQTGWVEFDLLRKTIPAGAQLESRFDISLVIDPNGNVTSHRIPPGCGVLPPPTNELEEGLPKPPKDWSDTAEVARYRREMEEWDRNSGLGRRKPKAE